MGQRHSATGALTMATKAADTWMAFYPGAYLSNTLHLTRYQHGSYLMLILAAFKAGGVLPNNDATLAAIARCSAKEWQAERDIYAAFFDVTDETWTHYRVSRELEKAERLTNQRRIAGTASATARQRKGNDRSTVDTPSLQRERRPSEPHPDNPSHGETNAVAPRAAGDPDGPPRAGAPSEPLPDSAKWAERLAGYRPWEGKRTWLPFWGPPPDSLQRNVAIPPAMLAQWRQEFEAAKARGEAA